MKTNTETNEVHKEHSDSALAIPKKGMLFTDFVKVSRRYSLSEECDGTPDYVIAAYLTECLNAFAKAVTEKPEYKKK
jgi:hypothetical protein